MSYGLSKKGVEKLIIKNISSLQKGDKGDKGDKGEPGRDGLDGNTMLNYDINSDEFIIIIE